MSNRCSERLLLKLKGTPFTITTLALLQSLLAPPDIPKGDLHISLFLIYMLTPLIAYAYTFGRTFSVPVYIITLSQSPHILHLSTRLVHRVFVFSVASHPTNTQQLAHYPPAAKPHDDHGAVFLDTHITIWNTPYINLLDSGRTAGTSVRQPQSIH